MSNNLFYSRTPIANPKNRYILKTKNHRNLNFLCFHDDAFLTCCLVSTDNDK